MKHKTFWGLGCLVLFMMVVLAGTAAAAISNHFVSTNEDSNTIQIKSLENGWYFGVFDYGNYDTRLDLLLGGSDFSTSKFKVTQDGSNYTLEVIQGQLNNGSSIDIGTSPDFQFYFRNNDGSIVDTTFDILPGNGPNTYLFSSDDGGNVVGVDLAPVPIPGSSVLLLSGLIGLVAIGRRQSKN